MCLKNREECFVNRPQYIELKATILSMKPDVAGAVEQYENLLDLNSLNFETYYSIL